MTASMSSWAQGIIVAIIIGTIIEMILPNGNNKKYVKTVIGVYILFVIISPIVSIFTGNIDISNLLDYERYIDTSTYQVNANNADISNTQNIENIYKQKLKEDLETRLKEKEYSLEKIDMDINLNEEDSNYGQIDNLNIKITKNNSEQEESTSINKIEKIEINIEENNINKADENKEISKEEIEELKEFIYENYGIDKSNININ